MSKALEYYEKIQAAEYIRSKSQLSASLGWFSDPVSAVLRKASMIQQLSRTRIFRVPSCSVSGHAGQLVVGSIAGKQIVVMQGRVHYYELHSMREVTFPVQVLAEPGIKHLLLTNAAGTVNETFAPGDVMIIRDHLNLTETIP